MFFFFGGGGGGGWGWGTVIMHSSHVSIGVPNEYILKA